MLFVHLCDICEKFKKLLSCMFVLSHFIWRKMKRNLLYFHILFLILFHLNIEYGYLWTNVLDTHTHTHMMVLCCFVYLILLKIFQSLKVKKQKIHLIFTYICHVFDTWVEKKNVENLNKSSMEIFILYWDSKA